MGDTFTVLDAWAETRGEVRLAAYHRERKGHLDRWALGTTRRLKRASTDPGQTNAGRRVDVGRRW
ncbi:MAG: hypothetical protein ABIQ53_01125, partial [Terracoccus sp.]